MIKIKAQGVLRVRATLHGLWPTMVNQGLASEQGPKLSALAQHRVRRASDGWEQRNELINRRLCSWGITIPLFSVFWTHSPEIRLRSRGSELGRARLEPKRQRSRSESPSLPNSPNLSTCHLAGHSLHLCEEVQFHNIFLPLRQIGQAGCHFLLDRPGPGLKERSQVLLHLVGEHLHPQIHFVDIVCGQVGLVPILSEETDERLPPKGLLELEREGRRRMRHLIYKRPNKHSKWVNAFHPLNTSFMSITDPLLFYLPASRATVMFWRREGPLSRHRAQHKADTQDSCGENCRIYYQYHYSPISLDHESSHRILHEDLKLVEVKKSTVFHSCKVKPQQVGNSQPYPDIIHTNCRSMSICKATKNGLWEKRWVQ